MNIVKFVKPKSSVAEDRWKIYEWPLFILSGRFFFWANGWTFLHFEWFRPHHRDTKTPLPPEYSFSFVTSYHKTKLVSNWTAITKQQTSIANSQPSVAFCSCVVIHHYEHHSHVYSDRNNWRSGKLRLNRRVLLQRNNVNNFFFRLRFDVFW